MRYSFGGYKITPYLCNRQNNARKLANKGEKNFKPRTYLFRWAIFYAHTCSLLQRRYGGCLPCEFTLVAKSHCFDEREEHPLFSYPYPAVLGNVKTMRNMQQVINFESSAKDQQPIDVRATIQRKIKSLNLWLDAKSEFYSRICEYSVTRRLVIRVNLVTLCVGLAAIAIEQQPITSVVSTICAGYLVYRINKSEKKGDKK